MFQSSRTAVGIVFLQTSSAWAPSSASVISKSISSRMRRAILRTTLESSTTRQVFIFWPPVLTGSSARPNGLRCECRVGREFENAIDVEDDHELAVEAVNAAGELGHAGIEVDRIFLAT